MLLARRRHPVAVLAGTFTGTLWYLCTTYARGPVYFALIAALIWSVKAGHRWAGVTSLVVGYPLFLWLPELVGSDKGPTLVGAVGVATWLLLLLVISEWIRARSQREAALARRRRSAAKPARNASALLANFTTSSPTTSPSSMCRRPPRCT
jgi:hypothetical protein